MSKSLWWILIATVPAVTLAAMTVAPRNLESALAAQLELAKQNPQDASVFNDLGNLLVLRGDLDKAEDAYFHAVEIEPSKVSARFNLALLLQQEGRNRAALEQYREVLRVSPSHAWTHYQIGTLYDLAKQDDLAVKSYARAFSLDPTLAFPEVNPQVIDNRLLTQALLLAHRSGSAAPLVPKSYDEPTRIAKLLVPPIPVPAQAEDEGEDGEMTEETTVAEEGEDLEDESPQRLTSGDLDPDAPANQAAPLDRFGRGGTTFRSPTRVRIPGNLRQFQQRAVPNTRTIPRVGGGRSLGNVVGEVPAETGHDSTSPTNPLADRPPGRMEVPPGSLPERFRPGTPSTGRLDIRLSPLHSEEELAAG